MRPRFLHRAYPSLHPSRVVHWVPEQLNSKGCNWASKLTVDCSLKRCVRLHLLAYATEKSQLNCMQRLCDWIKGRSISVSYIYIYIDTCLWVCCGWEWGWWFDAGSGVGFESDADFKKGDIRMKITYLSLKFGNICIWDLIQVREASFSKWNWILFCLILQIMVFENEILFWLNIERC